MSRALVLAILLVLIPMGAIAADWIYIYEDGQPVGYSVGSDFEFFYVDPADVATANRELFAGQDSSGPDRGALGYGLSRNQADTPVAEHYGARPDGVLVKDLMLRDRTNHEDWEEAWGDYVDSHNFYAGFSHAGGRWNWDSTTFRQSGFAYGLSLDEQNVQQYARDKRQRYQTSFVWRQGTMEGTTHNIWGRIYRVEQGPGVGQPIDVTSRQIGAGNRVVENNYSITGTVLAGRYSSERASMDNRWMGGSLRALHWFDPRMGVFFDGGYTSIDAGKQDGTANRTTLNGRFVWRVTDGLSLTGSAATWREDSSVAANSNLRGYDDLAARLEYHPGTDANLSLGLRRRNADAERLRLEDPAVQPLLFTDPAPIRSDLAPYREPSSAKSDRFDLRAHFHLADNVDLNGNWIDDNFDSLPSTGNFTDIAPAAPYFANRRRQGEVSLRVETDDAGWFALRTAQLQRINNPRDSSYVQRRHSLSYYLPAGCSTVWQFGLSRSDTSLDLTDTSQDWSAGSWNYDVSLNGKRDFGTYRLSYNRAKLGGRLAGSYDALGLELHFCDMPLYLNAWWRDRAKALGGVAGFSDSGVSIGYTIDTD